ncbi:MAG TPA: hypothetical protein VKR06_16370 [Ktedonosporobacter sp.]|nr:hypothetical protein [Ktedonosporobacter sp.]
MNITRQWLNLDIFPGLMAVNPGLMARNPGLTAEGTRMDQPLEPL